MSLPWMPRRRLIRAAVSEDGFPVVADFNTSNSTGTGTSSTVALPEDISAGDWLLIALGAEWTGSYDTPSGYVEVVQDNTAASPRAALAIFAREADGNEGASVNVSHSQFARTIHHSYRITGAAGAPAGEIDDGDSDAPNPPNLTPGGGSAKRLWLPFAANSPPRNVTGYPEGYTMDETAGLITFTTAPESGLSVTAGYEFDVPVRFDTDRIDVDLSHFEAGAMPDIPIVEIRL